MICFRVPRNVLGHFRRGLWGAFLLVFSICGYAVASPSLSVENVSFRQRYPWNGLVDIDCTVKCSDPTTNVSLYVTATDTVANRSLVVRNVRLDSEGPTDGVDGLTVTAGTHRIVWDAGADNPNFVSDTVVVEVQAVLGTGLYLISSSTCRSGRRRPLWTRRTSSDGCGRRRG